MSQRRKVKAAVLQTPSSNALFGADTTLNKNKQPAMTMEADGFFLYCAKGNLELAFPMPNVKFVEFAGEALREAGPNKSA